MPIFAIFQFRNAQKKARNIRSYRITNDGEEDLKLMYQNFRGAEEVTVHSGDYSWISTNEDLREVMLLLAGENKLTLISYKSDKEVQQGLHNLEIYQKLQPCLRYNPGVRIKCSLVKRPGDINVFLYRCETTEEGKNTNRIFELIDRYETRYLLSVLDKLMHSAYINP